MIVNRKNKERSLVLSYEYLYELNSKKYEEALVDHLLQYAMMLFINNKYKSSLNYLYKATDVSKDNEEYEFLRAFVEKLKLSLKDN